MVTTPNRRWAKTKQKLAARMAQTHSATKATPNVVLQTTTGVRLASGALAGCFADIITFPLDIAKVRLQIQGESADASKKSFSFARSKLQRKTFKYHGIFGTISTILKEEGVRGLYSGLNPGLQRQMCFCGVRLGLYDDIKQQYIRILGLDGINVYTRIAAGITSGGLSVIIAQPTDVVKVRLQAQGMNSSKPKRYTGAYHAYKTIFKEEGIRRGLWKGAVPNITRNAVVTASELVSYDLIKEYILHKQLLPDEMPCHFVSAFGAGFITTCVASPVDVVKTRFMNAPLGMYTGAINCAVRMFREGGPMAFYKGFLPNFMRLGSWNIVMFVTFEQLKRALMDFKNRDK